MSGQHSQHDTRWAAIYFSAIGVGYLFPFSALTQPVDYWKLLFPDFNIEFPMTALYWWVNLIFLFLLVFLGGEPSYSFRIVGGFIGQLLVLVAVPSLYFLDLSEQQNYVCIMGAVGFAAIATAYIDSVAISFASQYPLRVQEALQFGIGLSTLIGSVYRVLTKAAFPPDAVIESTLLYFYSGAATILFCIAAYYALLKLPISEECLQFGLDRTHTQGKNNVPRKRVKGKRKDKDNGERRSNDEESSGSPDYDGDLELELDSEYGSNSGSTSTLAIQRFSNSRGPSSSMDSTSNTDSNINISTNSHYKEATNSESLSLLHASQAPNSQALQYESFTMVHAYQDDIVSPIPPLALVPDKWNVLKKSMPMMVLVFLLFGSTLLLWPPLITEIKSFNFPELQESQWWPLLLLLLFAVADCMGRLMTPYRCGLTRHNIGWAVLLRLGLFPLLICSANGLYFTNDLYSIVFVFGLGYSNGYIGSLCVVMVNETVEEYEKGLAGTFTGFFINLGLVCGASLGSLTAKYFLK